MALIMAHCPPNSLFCLSGSAGSSSGEQDAEASEFRLGSVFRDGHRHLPLHQSGHHWIYVFWGAHRWEHHFQPAKLLVR